MCWPLLCLCRAFCIFERCLDSNPETCRSKQRRYQLRHPSFTLNIFTSLDPTESGSNPDFYPQHQSSGSMTFWGGSGSGSSDPCFWLMDPGSDPDPGSGSCYFRHWPSTCQQKTYFLTHFFLLITFWRYISFTSFFKDKKSKRVTKYKESRFFLLFLHDDRRIRIRIHTSD